MNSRWCARIIVVLAPIIIFAGCSRDPGVRKRKYLESGQRYFAKGRYREAAIQFANAIQVDPKYADAHYALAKADLRLQKWNLANREMARVIELQPQNFQAHLDALNLLIAARDFAEAQPHADLLLAQQPSNPQVHVAVADLQASQGKLADAVKEIQAAITLSPTQWEPYLTLAALQVEMEQLDLAGGNLEKAVRFGPGVTNTHMALGDYYRSQNRYAESEKQFLDALNCDPSDPNPYSALVRLYMLEGNRNKAETLLKDSSTQFRSNPAGYRLLADFYVASGDLDKASAEYTSLNRDHPEDLRVKKNYVKLLILQSRLDGARQLNDEILKRSPGDTDALIFRGEIQTRDGHASNGIETLQMAIKNEPQSGLAHYYLAMALETNGEIAQAESELQKAVQLQPDLSDAYKSLALTSLREGDIRELEQAADHIITLEPSTPDGYLFRSVAYLSRRQFSAAEKDVLQAIDLAPRKPQVYVQLGNLRFTQRELAEAKKAYEQALAFDASSADAFNGVINVYLVEKRSNEAVLFAKSQITKAPTQSAFYDSLGSLIFDYQRDIPDAEVAFQKAIEIDKHNTDAVRKLGQLEAAKGSFENAVSLYESSLKDNPNDFGFYILLGELYESKSNWEKAKEMYQKVLDMRPSNPLASNNLAYVMLQTGGNVDTALNLAQTARRGMPDSPNAADTLGWAFFRKGIFESAIVQFQDALKLDRKNRLPESATVHYHLALAYEQIGQEVLAKEHFQRVLVINPNYSEAAAVKQQLSNL